MKMKLKEQRMRDAAVRRFKRLLIEQLEQRLTMNSDWQNPIDAHDTNTDGFISPIDALVVINDLNRGGAGSLIGAPDATESFVDASGDQFLSPIDALIVINYLNQQGSGPVAGLLRESESNVHSEQTFAIEPGQPSGTRQMIINLDTLFSQQNAELATADVLAVYVVNRADPSTTLIDRGISGTAVFALAGADVETIPGISLWDGQNLIIDVSALKDRSDADLKIQLLNGDGIVRSMLRVNSLQYESDPNGTSSVFTATDTQIIDPGTSVNVSALSPNTTVALVASNIRYNSATGLYQADFRLDNRGGEIGKQAVVLINGLVAGASVLNASGVTAGGIPYINFAPAIVGPGLAPLTQSVAVPIKISNPNHAPLQITPTILTGPPNAAPTLAPLAHVNLKPGQRAEVVLDGSDPDGDHLVYTVTSPADAPDYQLNESSLSISPSPNQIGTFELQVIASDGMHQVIQPLRITVEDDPVKTTRVSGHVLDIDGSPIAGIRVEVGSVQALTQNDGSFLLDLGAGSLVSDTIKIRGELFTSAAVSYPFIAEKLPLLLLREVYAGVNNAIDRPIYLPPIDVANAKTINPSQTTVVTTAAIPRAAVTVAAGTLINQQGTPFTGHLSITEVPLDRTPAALPDGLQPDLIVTIQPGEMVFSVPAPLSLPNRSGYGPGTRMNLWSISPVTGAFEIVGQGQVSADGQTVETVSGGIRNSSWHFFSRDGGEFTIDDRNQDQTCSTGECTRKTNSEVSLHSGHLKEVHNLVAYQSLGTDRSLELFYDTERLANDRNFFLQYPKLGGDSGQSLVTGAAEVLVTFVASLYVHGSGGQTRAAIDPVVIASSSNSGSAVIFEQPYGATLRANMSDLPTGFYVAELTSGLVTAVGGSVASRSTTTKKTELLHVNLRTSTYGAGWGIAGLQELAISSGGVVALVDGGGLQALYRPLGNGSYQSPTGDFTKFERLADGTYRHTRRDQSYSTFSSSGLLTAKTDRVGNTTHFAYDSNRRLIRITDPVGLITTLTYDGKHLAQVIDPAGRTTALQHDSLGNLTRITDPDTSMRQFFYDGAQRMVREVDQRGLVERTFYSPVTGRVERTVRRDGSVLRITPAQAQHSQPAIIGKGFSYVLSSPTPPTAFFTDGNGNTTRYILDRFGQIVSSSDALGTRGTLTRDAQNRVIQTSDGRGNRTSFEYDARGNVVASESHRFYVSDHFSAPYSSGDLAGQGGGVGWSGSWTAGLGGNRTDRVSQVSLTYPGLNSEPGSVLADGLLGSGAAITSTRRTIGLPSAGSLYVGFLASYETLAQGSSENASFLRLSDTADVDPDKVLIGRTFTSVPQFSIAARNDNQPFSPETQRVAIAFGADQQSGALDSTFGEAGIVTTDFGIPAFRNEEANALLLQPDGKMIAIGSGTGSGGQTGFAARYHSDGSLDTSFSGDGLASFNVPSFTPVAAALQSDGKIVAVDRNWTLARLNADGTLDTSFGGGDGWVSYGGFLLTAGSIAIQSDGKILLGGEENGGNPNPDFRLMRCNPDGSIDTSFGGGDGVVTSNTGGYPRERIASILLLPDGRILAAGTGGSKGVALARYLSDGTPDLSFGSSGIVVTSYSNPQFQTDTVSSAVLQADGKIVVAGQSGGQMALARFDPAGMLDATFGSGGKTLINIGPQDDAATDVVVQPDGKIIVGGTTTVANGQDRFALARLFDNGKLDTGYGVAGIVTTDIPGKSPDAARAMLLQPDGKVVLAGITGQAAGNGASDFALARFLAGDDLAIATGSTHYLVARIDFDSGGPNTITGGSNDRIRLYVDPVPGLEPLEADAEISDVDVGTLNSSGFSSEGELVRFDEVRMGTAFSDLFDASASGPDQLFAARQIISGATGTEALALGDVNGDGNADLVYASSDTDTVVVQLGDGHGTFGMLQTFSAAEAPDSVVLADFNGDTRLDIASANLDAGSVSLWLADGSGSFQPRADFSVAARPDWIEVGDFNNDAHPDVVTLSQSRSLSVLLNDGSGVFSTRIDRDITAVAQSSSFIGSQVAVGDLNNDGNLDAAIATNGKVAILLGDGTGTLPTISTFDVSGQPDAVAIADANADGKLDLAIARRQANLVSVWLGDGAGGFPSHQDYATGLDPIRVQFADVNGDGDLDLISSQRTASTFSVRLGDGSGAFGPATEFAAGARPFSIASGDLDQDGDRDLVVGSSLNRILVFRNNTVDPVSSNQTGGIFRSSFTYDATFNQLTSTTDELGRQTLLDVDPTNGNVRSITQVVGLPDSNSGESDDVVTRFTYTTQGLIDTITDPLGRVTDYEYDALGRLVTATFALGTPQQATRSLGYDAAGNNTAIVDENGSRTQFEYDLLNRVTRIVEADPDGPGPLASPVTSLVYDAGGNVTRLTDAQGHITQSQYDDMDRVIRVTDERNNVTRFEYDNEGNRKRTFDPLGQMTASTFDRRHRLIESVDPDGGRTGFRYDAANNLTQVIDPVGNLTRFEYDFRNRVTSETDPLGKSIQYQYDGADNLIRRTDRNGRTTEFSYDDLDRLITETWLSADGSLANEISSRYDKSNNLTAIDDFFSALAYEYDARDRVTSVDNAGTPGAPRVVLDYAYDPAGNVLSVTDTINGQAGATTSYAYDALHRTTRITQTGAAGSTSVSDKRVDFAYNALGQYESINRYRDLAGTQLVVGTAYTYDDLNRLTDLRHRNGTSDIAFYSYSYDADSRITSITDIDGLTTYSYDDRDQLTGANHSDPTNPDETYTYDANGNRLSSHLHGNSYVTGPGNRLLSDGTYEYTYDDEGNMLRRTEIATGAYREFAWDHRNRLVGVVDNGTLGVESQRVAIAYDVVDRRILKSVLKSYHLKHEHFVYDREDVILDFESHLTGTLPTLAQRNLHGAGIDDVLAIEVSDLETQWLLSDHLRSTRDIVGGDMSALSHITYGSNGQLVSRSTTSATSRYLFASREFDAELELYYNRARYLDPHAGRFISSDPIGFAAGDMNLYRYANNRPVISSDPFGLDSVGDAADSGSIVQAPLAYWTKTAELIADRRVKDAVAYTESFGHGFADLYIGAGSNALKHSTQVSAFSGLAGAGFSTLSLFNDISILTDPCSSDYDKALAFGDAIITIAPLAFEKLSGPAGAAFGAGYTIGSIPLGPDDERFGEFFVDDYSGTKTSRVNVSGPTQSDMIQRAREWDAIERRNRDAMNGRW